MPVIPSRPAVAAGSGIVVTDDPGNNRHVVALVTGVRPADPTGGATIDTQARAQLASLLTVLTNAGVLTP